MDKVVRPGCSEVYVLTWGTLLVLRHVRTLVPLDNIVTRWTLGTQQALRSVAMADL